MGVVYYSNYLIWFECARTQWLRTLGTSYAAVEAQGLFLPARRCEVIYHESARYDRPVVVKTWVTKLTPARVDFAYQVRDEQTGALLAEGSTEHAFVEASGKVSRRGLKTIGIDGK